MTTLRKKTALYLGVMVLSPLLLGACANDQNTHACMQDSPWMHSLGIEYDDKYIQNSVPLKKKEKTDEEQAKQDTEEENIECSAGLFEPTHKS